MNHSTTRMTLLRRPFLGPLGILTIGVLLLLRHIALTVTRGVDTPLAAFVDPRLLDGGRLPWEALDFGPKAYLVVGVVMATVALAGALVSLSGAAIVFNRRGFVPALSRWLTVSAVFLLAWMVGKFVEHMGNNFAAQTLDEAGNWDSRWPVSSEAFVLWYIAIAVVLLLDYYLRRGRTIQEEQEDLV